MCWPSTSFPRNVQPSSFTRFTVTRLSKSVWRARPFAPSLDRIDARKGYTTDNVRLVAWVVNHALGDWGEEVFAKIARAYVDRL